jgi:tetratricopeptide (TPR) repeat protein
MDRIPGKQGPAKRKRWVLALILVLALAAAGAVVAHSVWRAASRKDTARLDLLYAAWSEFNSKRFAEASATLDRRLAEVPPTPLDWMLRARIAEAQGKLSEALDDLAHIPDSDPIGAQVWLKAGQIELLRHRARAAETAYRRALAIDPALIQSHRELAYLYAITRRRAECDAEFRALDRLVSLDYILAFAWSQNTCDLWDPHEARKILVPFVAEDPDDRPSRLALATSYLLTGEFEQAEDTLRALPDSDPDARAIRVQTALRRGETATAEDLVQGGPADHVELNVFRGQLAQHHGDATRAAAYFRAALRGDPANRDALQGLGVALRSKGEPGADPFLRAAYRHDQLKRAIQDSVTSLATDVKLFDRLGVICESIDRRDEARVWYRLAIGRDPLDAQAHQALARITQAAPEGPGPSGLRKDQPE